MLDNDIALDHLYSQVTLLADVEELLDRYATGRKVLDVGCVNYSGEYGFGLVHSMVLARSAECVGIDISPAIERLGTSSKARYFQADAEEFSLPETFELIFAGDLIEHLANPGRFLAKAAGMMNPASDLVIVTPNPYGVRSFLGVLSRFEPRIHPEHTMLVPISGMAEMARRNGLAIQNVYAIKGQELQKHDRIRARVYKRLYRALMVLPFARRLADTFAYRLRLASDEK